MKEYWLPAKVQVSCTSWLITLSDNLFFITCTFKHYHTHIKHIECNFYFALYFVDYTSSAGPKPKKGKLLHNAINKCFKKSYYSWYKSLYGFYYSGRGILPTMNALTSLSSSITLKSH